MKTHFPLKEWVVFFVGGSIILLAFLSPFIGVDHNRDWGTSRILLLLMGIAILLLGFALIRFGRVLRNWIFNSRIRHFFAGCVRLCQQIPLWIWVVPAVLLSLLMYVWFLTAGDWFSLPEVNNYYNHLAEAFTKGQVSLLITPDPSLVSLDNPYDPVQREEAIYKWDLSYYNGRYYLYWGPVPALMLVPLKYIMGASLPGQTGILIAAVIFAGLNAWLLIFIRERLFPKSSKLFVILFLLAVNINQPLMFIISRPQVYETAILFGQVFLIFGLLGMIHVCSSPKNQSLWLALTGVSWGLAVGSRYNLLASVFVLTIFFVIWLRLFSPQRWRQTAILLLPLIVSAGLLTLYNYLRFNNPFETGIRYQLTVPFDPDRVFSLGHLAANAKLYLLYPLNWQSTFPFLRFLSFDPSSYFAGWNLPPTQQFDEVFAGVIFASPVVLFVLMGVFVLGKDIKRERSLLTRFLMFSLFGAVIAQWLLLCVYYYSAVRFVFDVFPLTVLTAYVCVQTVFDRIGRNHYLSAALGLFVLAAALATILPGLVTGFDAPPQYFRVTHPERFQAIADQANSFMQNILTYPQRDTGYLGYLLRMIFY